MGCAASAARAAPNPEQAPSTDAPLVPPIDTAGTRQSEEEEEIIGRHASVVGDLDGAEVHAADYASRASKHHSAEDGTSENSLSGSFNKKGGVLTPKKHSLSMAQSTLAGKPKTEVLQPMFTQLEGGAAGGFAEEEEEEEHGWGDEAAEEEAEAAPEAGGAEAGGAEAGGRRPKVDGRRYSSDESSGRAPRGRGHGRTAERGDAGRLRSEGRAIVGVMGA